MSVGALDTMRAIAALRNLTGVQKAVLFALTLRADNETRRCWPSIATLADDAGVSRSCAKAAVYELARLGYIRIERRPVDGKRESDSNLYTIEVGRQKTDLGLQTTDVGREKTYPGRSPGTLGRSPESRQVGRQKTDGRSPESRELLTELPNGTAHTPTAPTALVPVLELSPSSKSHKPSRAKPRTAAPGSDATPAAVTEWAIRWAIPESDTEFPNFLDHHRKKGDLFADWTAAWRTWMRSPYRQAKAAGAKNGFAAQQPPPGGSVWQRAKVLPS